MASKATGRALNIGVSDLLDIGCHHAGTLYIQKNSIRKNKSKWSSRFVIISWGWIYIFRDRNSKKAEKTFPLGDFIRVDGHHHVSGENFCFCLIYSGQQKKDPVIFSCEVEGAKRTWMKHFEEAIEEVNKAIYGSQASQADSDYESITAEGRNSFNGMLVLAGNQPAVVEADDSGLLRRKQTKSFNKWKRKSMRTEPMSVNEKCDKCVSADFGQEERGIDIQYEKEYSNHNQAAIYSRRKGMEPPPLPVKLWKKTSSQGSLLRNNTEPIIPNTEQDGETSVAKSHSYVDVAFDSISEVTSCASSSRKSRYISRATFICELPSGAVRILKDQPVGNFLVCPSKESTWVLLVKTKEKTSEILIHTNEENRTLSLGTNASAFRTLSDLIKFYQLNKLPLENEDMVLKECGNEYSKREHGITFV